MFRTSDPRWEVAPAPGLIGSICAVCVLNETVHSHGEMGQEDC